MSRATPRDCNF